MPPPLANFRGGGFVLSLGRRPAQKVPRGEATPKMNGLFPALLAFLVIGFLPAVAGAMFRPGDWYRQLDKPCWHPPNWLFGPVWMALYATIGLSGWLLWRKAGFSDTLPAFSIYAAQMALNAIWSPIFFGLRRPGLALLEIGVLWVSIAGTVAAFLTVDIWAALVLLPYLAWVTFAAVLNHAIWRRNRHRIFA